MTKTLAFALVLMLVPTLALAQETGGTIDFGPLISEVVIPILGALLTLVGSWAVTQLAGWLGMKKTGEVMQGLDGIVRQGVAMAERKAKNYAQESSLTKVDIENRKVAEAANHVMMQAPGWLKKAGVTPAQVEEWVRSLIDTPELDKAEAKKGKAS